MYKGTPQYDTHKELIHNIVFKSLRPTTLALRATHRGDVKPDPQRATQAGRATQALREPRRPGDVCCPDARVVTGDEDRALDEPLRLGEVCCPDVRVPPRDGDRTSDEIHKPADICLPDSRVAGDEVVAASVALQGESHLGGSDAKGDIPVATSAEMSSPVRSRMRRHARTR